MMHRFIRSRDGHWEEPSVFSPGIIHALTFNRPLVLSSHTIALQEQLERKDLPLCRELFTSIPELNRFAEFKTALLVGRGNYLCTLTSFKSA